MSSIPRVSLEDTLHLLQLARESALARGQAEKAETLKPVTEQIGKLVNSAPVERKPALSSATVGQADFSKLLELTQSKTTAAPPSGDTTTAILERNRMVVAMAAAHMSKVDIARQLNMTREEVQLVMSVHTKGAGLRSV